ncbi:IS4 family transposase, partial [Vibrio cholerae]|nr:IS4 family transposase [Vibrio cholerae]
AQAIAKQVPETLIISVADREGDLYDIYHEANIAAEENKAYWLIRAKTNRRLLDKHDNLREEKLIETVKNNSPIGYIEFEIPA